MAITTLHIGEEKRVIEDYYFFWFKKKWLEVTERLKALGYDYSHIKITEKR